MRVNFSCSKMLIGLSLYNSIAKLQESIVTSITNLKLFTYKGFSFLLATLTVTGITCHCFASYLILSIQKNGRLQINIIFYQINCLPCMARTHPKIGLAAARTDVLELSTTLQEFMYNCIAIGVHVREVAHDENKQIYASYKRKIYKSQPNLNRATAQTDLLPTTWKEIHKRGRQDIGDQAVT
ncbi:hypothetical protein ACJX0J_033687, partial [Zea mays]